MKNDLKGTIEANSARFDRSSVLTELNLDLDRQYLELESCKRKFVLSPNSPFVPSKNKI
jgi:hypothetical protein